MLETLLNSLASLSKAPAIINGKDYPQSSYLGVDVAITKNAKTLLVGAYGSSFYGSNSGGILSFELENGKYVHKQNIFPNRAGGRFGRCIALSKDGNTAVVSASSAGFNALNSGAIYIISRSGEGQPFTVGPALYESDVGYQNSFGYEVAISDDAQYVAASTIQQQVGTFTGAGAVYIYKRQSNGSYSFLNKIVSPNPEKDAAFGKSLSFYKDSSELIVGEHTVSIAGANYSGRVNVFNLKNGVFTFKNNFADPTGLTGTKFGSAVLACDNYLVVTSPGGSVKINNTYYVGAIHLYKRSPLGLYNYVNSYRKELKQISTDFYESMDYLVEKNTLYASSLKYINSTIRNATVEKFVLSDTGLVYTGELESPNTEALQEQVGSVTVASDATLALGLFSKHQVVIFKNS